MCCHVQNVKAYKTAYTFKPRLSDYDNTKRTSAKEIGEHLKETAVVPFTSVLCSWSVCYNHSFFSLRIKNNNAHIKKHLDRSTLCAYDFQYQYHFANLLCMLQDEARALETKFCSYSYLQFPFSIPESKVWKFSVS